MGRPKNLHLVGEKAIEFEDQDQRSVGHRVKSTTHSRAAYHAEGIVCVAHNPVFW